MRVEIVNVRETAAALEQIGAAAPLLVQDALTRGGKWTRYHARNILSGQITQTYLPHYALSITSEVEHSGGMYSMIVGPETRKKQGGMGPGVEFGSSNAPPFPHLFKAFDDRVESIIDRAARNIANWPGESTPTESEPPE
jgi:hypothetical protein